MALGLKENLPVVVVWLHDVLQPFGLVFELLVDRRLFNELVKLFGLLELVDCLLLLEDL